MILILILGVWRGRKGPCGLGAAQEIPLGFSPSPKKTRVVQCRWADFRGRSKSLELSLCAIDIKGGAAGEEEPLRKPLRKPLRNPCGNPKFQGSKLLFVCFSVDWGFFLTRYHRGVYKRRVQSVTAMQAWRRKEKYVSRVTRVPPPDQIQSDPQKKLAPYKSTRRSPRFSGEMRN